MPDQVEGKIIDACLTCADIKTGKGRFEDRSIPDVDILDCKRLQTATMEGDKKVFSPSASFRVTFPGSILPKFVLIENVFYPVRLFVPKVYNCTKCKQLGHSAAHCDNKPRCGKCGQAHNEDSCEQVATKCAYCSKDIHALQNCPAYKKRTRNESRAIIVRSKQSYAEMVKKTKVSATDSASAVPVENSFEVLSSEEEDVVVVDDAGSSEVLVNGKRKSPSSPHLRRKKTKASIKNLQTSQGSGEIIKNPKNQAPAAPGPSNGSKDPPPLPPRKTVTRNVRYSSAKPATKVTRSSKKRSTAKRGQISFSALVDRIYDALGVSDSFRGILDFFVPVVQEYLRNLTISWPLLASIISFDG